MKELHTEQIYNCKPRLAFNNFMKVTFNAHNMCHSHTEETRDFSGSAKWMAVSNGSYPTGELFQPLCQAMARSFNAGSVYRTGTMNISSDYKATVGLVLCIAV